MYGLISWIICGFAIFCILINIVYTIVYSLKSDNSKTICFGDLIFTNIIGIFVCVMSLVFLEPINILGKLFLVILGDVIFCILLFYASYDAVYKDYKDQIKQDNMNKSIKL